MRETAKEFWNDIGQVMAVMAIAIFVVAVACSAAAAIPVVLGEIQHCALLDETEIPHKWLVFGGCKVQRPNGMWTHYKNYYMLEQILPLE